MSDQLPDPLTEFASAAWERRYQQQRRECDRLRAALKPYLNQHNLGERDLYCVCSYCNAARVALREADDE